MTEITQLKTLVSNSLPVLEDKIDYRSLFLTLLAEKKTILIVTAIMVILGSLYAMTRIPSYEANVLLHIENKQGSGSFFSTSSLGALTKSPNPTDVQIALIKSRFILIPVVESLALDITARPRYFPVIGTWFARHHNNQLQAPLFGLNQYAWGGENLEITNMQVPREYLGQRFTLVAGEKNTYQVFTSVGKLLMQGKVGILSQVETKDVPGLKILVKALHANPGTEFFVTKLSTDNIADKIASELQITDLGQLYQNEKTGVLKLSFAGANPRYIVDLLNAVAQNAVQKDIARKSLEADKTIKFLEAQLPLAKASLSSSEEALNNHQRKKGTIDTQLKKQIIVKKLTAVQREIEKANLLRIKLLQQYTPRHPFIIALKNKNRAMQNEFLSLEKELQNLPATDKVSRGLIRDIKVKSQLYLILLHKIQELQVMKAAIISEVRILNLAVLPNSSLPLGRGLIILATLLLGLIIGSLIVFARKMINAYVDDPNWLEQHFGIPTFAIIPYTKEQKLNVQNYKEQKLSRLKLLAQTQSRDLAIESLRSLRTSLQFALLGAKNNIIAILGISPGTGKSFVSANFAYILADIGKRVLLIDGDIRKGYLHKYFGKHPSPGLSEAVSGQVPVADIIQKTELPQLDFIATGKFPPNPSELLMSENFQIILTTLSSQYDLVLIDTAPILAVTDGTIIGNHSGVNFLLMGWGQHQAEEIELTMKRLQSNGIKIQGVIVNSVEPRKATQSRYNYHYDYGS